jgi:hypothetical protein
MPNFGGGPIDPYAPRPDEEDDSNYDPTQGLYQPHYVPVPAARQMQPSGRGNLSITNLVNLLSGADMKRQEAESANQMEAEKYQQSLGQAGLRERARHDTLQSRYFRNVYGSWKSSGPVAWRTEPDGSHTGIFADGSEMPNLDPTAGKFAPQDKEPTTMEAASIRILGKKYGGIDNIPPQELAHLHSQFERPVTPNFQPQTLNNPDGSQTPMSYDTRRGKWSAQPLPPGVDGKLNKVSGTEAEARPREDVELNKLLADAVTSGKSPDEITQLRQAYTMQKGFATGQSRGAVSDRAAGRLLGGPAKVGQPPSAQPAPQPPAQSSNPAPGGQYPPNRRIRINGQIFVTDANGKPTPAQ